MTPRTVMVTADGNQPISRAQQDAGEWRYTRVPIYDESADQLKGYVLRYEVLSADEASLDALLKTLSKPIRFVSPETNALVLLNRMLSKREHLYAVVDQYGGVMGLVSLEDVLETLVGTEIVDEKDDVVDTQALAKAKGKAVIDSIEKEEEESP